jgi:hypothetical protein
MSVSKKVSPDEAPTVRLTMILFSVLVSAEVDYLAAEPLRKTLEKYC